MLVSAVHLLCVIPARIGSTRLIEKPLRLLAGEPLIRVVTRHVLGMELGGTVVVASDDPKVLAAVEPLGVRSVLTDPRHRSGTERVAEVVSRLPVPDVVLNVQGDEPFLPRAAAQGAIDRVVGGDDVGTTAQPLEAGAMADPHRVKVVVDGRGRAIRFFRTPSVGNRPAGSTVRQHLGVYAYRPSALAQWVALPPAPRELDERLEQLRPLAHGMTIGVAALTRCAPHGIDTERDLRFAEALL